MQELPNEQRKAVMLVDDGAPVRLNVTLQSSAAQKAEPTGAETKVVAFAQDEEDGFNRRKVPLVKPDSSVAEDKKAIERLEKIRENVPRNKESLFQAKVRWDGLTDVRFFYPVLLRFAD